MKKFEYSVMNVDTTGKSEDFKIFLDNMGDNGWELIQMDKGSLESSGKLIFKREIAQTGETKQLLLEENGTTK